jgi:2-dehydropantoate 2-reductase
MPIISIFALPAETEGSRRPEPTLGWQAGTMCARFVVFGAGAIGGVIAAQLHRAGSEVTAIARGTHLAAIQAEGLRIETPRETATVRLRAVAAPDQVEWSGEEVVILAMKSQDTDAALRSLALAAPPSVVVVCAQNGVANEPAALRIFANVLGVCVMLPATHLVPGVVQAHSIKVTGILDAGRYPRGIDRSVESVTAALQDAGFAAVPRPDIMRWKYTKLLLNLGNAVDALCSRDGRSGRLLRMVREEGRTCLDAAGIAHVAAEEDRARRGDLIELGPAGGRERGGGSTWQSLSRGAGTIETDYLNGEVVLLGRLHGVATPANQLLQQTANRAARDRLLPGRFTEAELLGRLGAPKP